MLRGIERVDVSSQPRLPLSMGLGSLVLLSILVRDKTSVSMAPPNEGWGEFAW